MIWETPCKIVTNFFKKMIKGNWELLIIKIWLTFTLVQLSIRTIKVIVTGLNSGELRYDTPIDFNPECMRDESMKKCLVITSPGVTLSLNELYAYTLMWKRNVFLTKKLNSECWPGSHISLAATIKQQKCVRQIGWK